MSGKLLIIGSFVFLLVAVGILMAVQSQRPDIPPGVIPEMWIPINQSAGVALSLEGPTPGYSNQMRGTLMIKSHGVWQKIFLEHPPATTRPLN